MTRDRATALLKRILVAILVLSMIGPPKQAEAGLGGDIVVGGAVLGTVELIEFLSLTALTAATIRAAGTAEYQKRAAKLSQKLAAHPKLAAAAFDKGAREAVAANPSLAAMVPVVRKDVQLGAAAGSTGAVAAGGAPGQDPEGDPACINAARARLKSLSPNERAALMTNYARDLRTQTGRALTDEQVDLLTAALRKDSYGKVTDGVLAVARRLFAGRRSKIIAEWEQKNGETWPRYAQNVLTKDSTGIYRNAGDLYDAHHIIKLELGGPNEWWNLIPASSPDQHQRGIHRKGGPLEELEDYIAGGDSCSDG